MKIKIETKKRMPKKLIDSVASEIKDYGYYAVVKEPSFHRPNNFEDQIRSVEYKSETTEKEYLTNHNISSYFMLLESVMVNFFNIVSYIDKNKSGNILTEYKSLKYKRYATNKGMLLYKINNKALICDDIGFNLNFSPNTRNAKNSREGYPLSLDPRIKEYIDVNRFGSFSEVFWKKPSVDVLKEKERIFNDLNTIKNIFLGNSSFSEQFKTDLRTIYDMFTNGFFSLCENEDYHIIDCLDNYENFNSLVDSLFENIENYDENEEKEEVSNITLTNKNIEKFFPPNTSKDIGICFSPYAFLSGLHEKISRHNGVVYPESKMYCWANRVPSDAIVKTSTDEDKNYKVMLTYYVFFKEEHELKNFIEETVKQHSPRNISPSSFLNFYYDVSKDTIVHKKRTNKKFGNHKPYISGYSYSSTLLDIDTKNNTKKAKLLTSARKTSIDDEKTFCIWNFYSEHYSTVSDKIIHPKKINELDEYLKNNIKKYFDNANSIDLDMKLVITITPIVYRSTHFYNSQGDNTVTQEINDGVKILKNISDYTHGNNLNIPSKTFLALDGETMKNNTIVLSTTPKKDYVNELLNAKILNSTHYSDNVRGYLIDYSYYINDNSDLDKVKKLMTKHALFNKKLGRIIFFPNINKNSKNVENMLNNL